MNITTKTPTLSLEEQIQKYKTTGLVHDREGRTSCHGFYDWFCKDSSLEKKSKQLIEKVIKFLKVNPQIDATRHYVFFKNNCPVSGPLYDSFSICERATMDVVYWVTPKSGHSGLAEVCSREAGFGVPMAVGKNFSEMLKNMA